MNHQRAMESRELNSYFGAFLICFCIFRSKRAYRLKLTVLATFNPVHIHLESILLWSLHSSTKIKKKTEIIPPKFTIQVHRCICDCTKCMWERNHWGTSTAEAWPWTSTVQGLPSHLVNVVWFYAENKPTFKLLLATYSICCGCALTSRI